MNLFLVNLWNAVTLAQAEAGGEGGAAPGGAAGEVAAPPGNPMMQIMLMLIIGVFFYLIVIRPQTRAQKEKRIRHEELMAGLKKNDRIVTIGGIIGTVAEITDDRVTIKIDDNTRMKLLRSSIQERFSDKSDKSELES